jgi:hypothetical protein
VGQGDSSEGNAGERTDAQRSQGRACRCNARKAAHAAFDPIWMEGDMSRRKAYAWLAQSLGLSVEETHIGVFNVETCQRVITLAKALRAEQAESCLV